MLSSSTCNLVLLFLFVSLACSQVCVPLPVSISRYTINNNSKANLTNTWVMQFIGTYPAGLTKISAMQFAVHRINSQLDLLPNNSNGDKPATLSGAIASYYSAEGLSGFIGGETFTDAQYVQYMASSYGTPQINPSAVEAALSSASAYPTLLNIIPSSLDQQNVVVTLMKYFGIKSALIITTNNQYGNEFNTLPYNQNAVANNMTFQIITISTSLSDSAQKLALAAQYIPIYRYVICHGSAFAITSFISILGAANLTGPDYLYFFTHQIAVALVEKPNSYKTQYPFLDGAIGIVAKSQDDNDFASQVLDEWSQTSTKDYAGAKTNIRSSWFAFDTVYAYAYALDAMLKDGYTLSNNKTNITGPAYLSYLMKSDFVGVTGRVTFDPATHGRPGLWDIVNFNMVNNTTITTTTVNQTDPNTGHIVAVDVNTTKTTTAFTSNFRAVACYNCTALYQVTSDFIFFGGNTTIPPPFIPCPKDCDVCTPDGAACITCSMNKYLFQGLCLSQCPNSSYTNTTSFQCQPPACAQDCLNCTTDGSVCFACLPNRFLFQGLCVSQCPNSTYYNTSLSQCVAATAPPQKHKMRDYLPAISIALGVIIGVAALLAIFAALMLVSFWEQFSKHGSFYCALIITGVFVAYVSVLVLLPAPTDSLCLAFPWLLGIGFTLVYGCLFIKTWALFMVYRSAEQLKKTKLTPIFIIARIALYVLVEIVFLVIWSAVDRPKVHYKKMVDDSYQLQCVTDTPAFWAIFAASKGLWLVFGSILSVLTRHVAREYNESKSIAYAIYNIIALLIIAIPLAVALKDIPGGLLIIEVGVVVIAFSFTLFSLFFPIWYAILFPNKLNLDSYGMSRSTSSYMNSRNTSQASHASSSPRQSQNQQASKRSKESTKESSLSSLSKEAEREPEERESLSYERGCH